jgi:NitT/TauT family transport system substrate-binding protein
MKTLRLAVCIAAIVLGSWAAAPAAAENALAQAAPAGLVPVRVVTTANDDVAPLLYAVKTGLFEKAGLDVQILRGPTSGAAVAAAVLGGTYDIGKSSISTIFDAHMKGLPFTIVAPAAIYDAREPFGGLIVAKSSPIQTGKDLAGKVIGLASLSDITGIATDAWTDHSGGDRHAFHYVELPMTAVSAAIDAGRIDAGEVVYPPLASAMATGRVRLIPVLTAIAPTFLLSAWIARSDWAAAHRDTVRTFYRVLTQAAAYANAHHDDTAPLVADFTSLPLSLIESMPRVVNGVALRASQVQPVIDAAARDQTIPHGFAAQEILDADVSTK